MKSFMKFTGLLVSCFILFSACTKDADTFAPPPSAKKDKVEVCHLDDDGQYVLISVSENAVKAHLKHGDKLFTKFGALGQYHLLFDNHVYGGIWEHDMYLQYNEGGVISGYGIPRFGAPRWDFTGTIDENGFFNFVTDDTSSDYSGTVTGSSDCDGFAGTWYDNFPTPSEGTVQLIFIQ